MKKSKRISRRIVCLVMAVMLVLSLAACGGIEGGSKSKKTVTVDAASAGQTLLQNGGFTNPDALTSRDATYTGTIFNAEIPEDFVYMSTDDGTADMLGVFVCADKKAASELQTSIASYIADMKAESDRYQPEEAAKLENAVIKADNNVVVLCVSEDADAAKSAADNVFNGSDEADNGDSGNDETYSETTVTIPVIEASSDVETINGLIRCGNACYECWYYNSDYSQRYADSVAKIKAAMPSNVNVYNMLIPLSSSITLPDDLEGKYEIGDQPGSIEKINGLVGSNATHVNIYNTLRSHRNEYVYFRTDHHWTGLGAYYAYSEFMKTKGATPNPISAYETVEFEGFLGEFYTSTKRQALADTPDTIKAYYPVNNSSIKMTITESSGKTFEWPIVNDVNSYGASLKYSTFAGADNPYTIITNSAVTDGSTCIVVKESFGNALIPFLADHYSTVYVIDYRYYTGNIAELVPATGTVDMLFANNLSMMQNRYLIGKIEILANNCR